MDKGFIIQELKIQNKLKNLYEMVEKKQYDEIYEIFGREAYFWFVPNDYKKQDIAKLTLNKQYSTLYNKYGKISLFLIRDLRKNITRDISDMMEKGQYENIYNKYGIQLYNKQITKMQKKDILNEIGETGKYILYKAKHKGISGIKNLTKILASTPIIFTVMLGGVNIYNQNIAKLNSELYQSEQLKYEQKIEEYASEINSMNLNDLQIIMKVIDDTWKSVDGYGNPKYDVYGLWRLDLLNENGAVKCRNLADDFTAKMNEINPEYNARNLPVYQDASYYNNDSLANIDRTVSNKHYLNNMKKYTDFTFKTDKDVSKYLGNHMVTILEIPNENITLVVDSLNPSLGVLKNGKIYMLSTENGKGIDDTMLGTIIYTPVNNYINNSVSKTKSFFTEYTIQEINEKYGIEAQNEALNYVRNLDKNIRR